jgi:hypothetical protein
MIIIRTSEEAGEIYGALAKAQAELENVERGGTNPHYRSKYTQLSAVVDEVRPKLSKNGICYIQAAASGENGQIGVVTRLAHSSGQWIENEPLYVAPAKTDAQGVGSVITYLRRYTLLALVGIAPDDDDGEAAVGHDAFISEKEAQEIEALIEASGSDTKHVCDVLKVKHLREIPREQFARVKRSLSSKAAKARA